MTREDIKNEIISLKGSNWLLELATGTGKSKLALDKLQSIYNKNKKSLLIVVPRNIHKKNWEDEINKWWKNCPLEITFTTYVSFPKHIGKWDYAIFDECHHLSDRCREALCDFNIKHSILLSATVSNSLKDELKEVFTELCFYSKSLREVIDNNILPDPKVYLLPLKLDTIDRDEMIWHNKNAKKTLVICNWEDRWKHIKQKNYPVKIKCTQRQYLSDLNNKIEYWKKRYMRSKSDIAKNKWLRLCSDRLNWLSDKKLSCVMNILYTLKNHRTLTFCNNIEHTELLGKHCINSKNKNSISTIDKFNRGIINHITACNMLNEGMNLVNCQIGIYANLNSSETIIKQRTGRLLRHKNPIIIIPYFENSRDEELVEKMLENYNPELIITINSVYEIKI